MDFVLYSSKGNLISGKAKLLSDTKEKMSKATDKKVAFVFKYDWSGILSVTWAEAILTLPDTSSSSSSSDKSSTSEKFKDQSFAMELV